MKYKNIAFLFPGQGAQYSGMGKDFYDSFSIYKETLEEAEDILKENIYKIIDSPDNILEMTKCSQPAIFVNSVAILRVLQQQIADIKPSVCAGLSLGEYTALFASQHINFEECLNLVRYRSQYMNDSCIKTKGTMAVILGLSSSEVEKIVQKVNLPKDLWIANFNCPGQVVISVLIKV